MKGRSAGVTWILALLFTGGCEFYHYEIPSPDRLWHIIPWFDHMITARYVRPYETADVPRYTPVGTVPVMASVSRSQPMMRIVANDPVTRMDAVAVTARR